MKKKPKVSVCVPAYNSEKIIGRAIKSILNQTFTNFELIIIDDTSTDNTDNIVKSFRDPRIKCFRNFTNIGWRANIKKCYEYARGDYITILCHDDFLRPRFLERGVEIFEKYPNVGIWACGSMSFDENGNVSRYHTRPRLGYIKNDDYFRYTYKMEDVSPPSETIISRDCMFKAGGYNDKDYKYSPEVDLYLRIAKNGYDAYHSKERLSCRTNWKESISTRAGYAWIRFVDRFKIINEYKNHRYIDKNTYFEALNFNLDRAFEVYVGTKMRNIGESAEIFHGLRDVLKKEFPFKYYELFFFKIFIDILIKCKLINILKKMKRFATYILRL